MTTDSAFKTNYRPISVLPTVSTIYGRVMYKQMMGKRMESKYHLFVLGASHDESSIYCICKEKRSRKVI